MRPLFDTTLFGTFHARYRHALISCNKTLKVRKVFFKTFKELLLLNEIAAENHNVQGNSIKNSIIYNIIRGFKLSKSC